MRSHTFDRFKRFHHIILHYSKMIWEDTIPALLACAFRLILRVKTETSVRNLIILKGI